MVAVVLQPQVVTTFANDSSLGYGLASLKSVWSAMADGFTASIGYPQIDTLFYSGGMSSMLSTVWLILGAMSFGAMIFNARLITPVISRVKSVGGTNAAVRITAFGLNIVAGDQYIYLPYCFLNLLNFLLGKIYGFVGFNMMRLQPDEALPTEPLAEVLLVLQDK